MEIADVKVSGEFGANVPRKPEITVVFDLPMQGEPRYPGEVLGAANLFMRKSFAAGGLKWTGIGGWFLEWHHTDEEGMYVPAFKRSIDKGTVENALNVWLQDASAFAGEISGAVEKVKVAHARAEEIAKETGLGLEKRYWARICFKHPKSDYIGKEVMLDEVADLDAEVMAAELEATYQRSITRNEADAERRQKYEDEDRKRAAAKGQVTRKANAALAELKAQVEGWKAAQ